MNSKSILFRTGSSSVPAQLPLVPGSSRHSVSLPVHGATAGVFNSEIGVSSPRFSLHIQVPRRNIRRSSSEPNLISSEMRTASNMGSRSFTVPRIPEVEYSGFGGEWTEIEISREDLGAPGGGMDKNGKSGGGGSGGNGSDADRQKMGDYYKEKIKSNPTNSLFLRNYAKYLHEVEGNSVKAEEYYGRAILAGPGDGEVLSLYGKLIWETQRDVMRAKSYFTQALQASPNDCMVLGSYAHFLWEAEEEQCEDGEEEMVVAAMVEAF